MPGFGTMVKGPGLPSFVSRRQGSLPIAGALSRRRAGQSRPLSVCSRSMRFLLSRLIIGAGSAIMILSRSGGVFGPSRSSSRVSGGPCFIYLPCGVAPYIWPVFAFFGAGVSLYSRPIQSTQRAEFAILCVCVCVYRALSSFLAPRGPLYTAYFALVGSGWYVYIPAGLKRKYASYKGVLELIRGISRILPRLCAVRCCSSPAPARESISRSC